MGEVAIGASVLGTYMTMQGQGAAAKGRAAASRYNAAIDERNAKAAEIDAEWTELKGDIETLDFVDDFKKLTKETGQRIRNNGWTFTGTGQDIILESAKRADEEIAYREVNIASNARAFREQGVNYQLSAELNRINASNALRAGRYQQMSTLLSGVSNVGMMGHKAGYF